MLLRRRDKGEKGAAGGWGNDAIVDRKMEGGSGGGGAERGYSEKGVTNRYRDLRRMFRPRRTVEASDEGAE